MRTGLWIGLGLGLVMGGVWLADRLAGPTASGSTVLAICVCELVIAGLVYKACAAFGDVCQTITLRGEESDADTGTAALLADGPSGSLAGHRLGWPDQCHVSAVQDDQRRRLAARRRDATDAHVFRLATAARDPIGPRAADASAHALIPKGAA